MSTPEGEYSSLTVDDICLKDEICAMKIDVEGHELQVLKGATEVLKKYSPVLWVEIKEKGLEEKMNFLLSLGYVVAKKRGENYFFYKIEE